MELLRYQEKPAKEIQDAIDEGIKYMESFKSPNRAETPDWGTDGIVVTSLRPDDVGLGGVPSTTNGQWVLNLAAAGWNQSVINRTFVENIYIVVIGVRKGVGSVLTELQFVPDGKELPVINVEDIQNWEEGLAYFSKPFGIKPEKTLVVHARGTAISATDPFQILGYGVKVALEAKKQIVTV